jgi:hypothetical protein
MNANTIPSQKNKVVSAYFDLFADTYSAGATDPRVWLAPSLVRQELQSMQIDADASVFVIGVAPK